MAGFREIWSREPTLRLGTALQRTEVGHGHGHGGRRMQYTMGYTPTLRGQTPIPVGLRDDRLTSGTAAVRSRTKTFDIERIYNPQNIIPNFRMTDCDEVKREYDIRSGQDTEWIERTVGMVDLPRLESIAQTTDIIADIAPYFGRSGGFIADDPETIYNQWCEIMGVQPVATEPFAPARLPPELATAIRRLRNVVEGVPGHDFQIDMFVNRVLASSGHPRSAVAAITRMREAMLHGEGALDAMAYLDNSQADEFRVIRTTYDMTRGRSMMETQPPVRNDPMDVADMIRRYADPPASVVAFAGGVIIPTDHPGRRAVIIE